MDIQDQLDHLISSGVLSVTEEDELRISEEHLGLFRGLKDELSSEDVNLSSQNGVEGSFELEELVESHEEYVCHVLALQEQSPSLDSNDILKVSFLLCNIDSLAPNEDSLTSFLPVLPDQIDLASKIFTRLLVYVWTDDCKPCEIMEERFQEIAQDGLGDVIPLSVYGPDNPQHLQQEYDIGIAPTFVFMNSGHIMERSIGAQSKEDVVSSIEQLRED